MKKLAFMLVLAIGFAAFTLGLGDKAHAKNVYYCPKIVKQFLQPTCQVDVDAYKFNGKKGDSVICSHTERTGIFGVLYKPKVYRSAISLGGGTPHNCAKGDFKCICNTVCDEECSWQ